jgi:peptidoglycan/LPS O-acetylase OafA/YrhL
LLTVLGLGLFFTTLPALTYLGSKAIYVYFLKCATLLWGIEWSLPGVFETNPYKNAVNGSLWSMPYELRMYATLLVLWLALRVVKATRVRIFEAAIVLAAVASAVLFVTAHFLSATEYLGLKLFFMFFSGAAYYVLRERIALQRGVFLGCVIALGVSAWQDKQAFFVVYTLVIAYVLFYLAYVPAGPLRKYNRLGDYSYGLYIYAFPVQQAIAASFAGISVLAMVGMSAAVTLVLAVASWHLLEKRALGLKGRYVGHTHRFLGFGQPG